MGDLINEEGSAFLEEQDKLYNKNKDINQESSIKSNVYSEGPSKLGNSTKFAFESSINAANNSNWKTVPIENLPSQGLFYPNESRISIKSATVSEVRQWSTIDESDRLHVDDTLNFIIEKCARIEAPGKRMTWRDISELDRLALLFMIQEITFPNDENLLYVNFSCLGPCTEELPWSGELRVSSPMLSFIDLPSDIMQFYNAEYKCFVIKSSKLNETFYLYMPTIGVIEKLRSRISYTKQKSKKSIDKAFIKIAPYLIQDWQTFTQSEYDTLSKENFAWHINKFTFVTKFVDILEGARNSMVSTSCPKCGNKVSSPLFSKSGFTIKDLFFISGGLNELI